MRYTIEIQKYSNEEYVARIYMREFHRWSFTGETRKEAKEKAKEYIEKIGNEFIPFLYPY